MNGGSVGVQGIHRVSERVLRAPGKAKVSPGGRGRRWGLGTAR
jgi:hypothetical protein